ncbi:MAG: acetate/propionate family kinase [Bacteroidia bacterium]
MKSIRVHILVINGGSSSIKFALYDIDEKLSKIFSGQIKKIGSMDAEFTVYNKLSYKKSKLKIEATNYKRAAVFLIDSLKKENYFETIVCVGHRIVHGMNHTHPEVITDKLLKELNHLIEYDPDHLPAEIEMIQLFKIQFPQLMQVACFDTSFHTAMPRVAKILPIPRRFDRAGIQRYGFHGLSFTYLMETLKNINGKDESKGRIILAHLGNGASLAAVKDGKSLDTSMGFTPAGGLMMGTRPGDLDPGVAWYILQSEKMTTKQFNQLINHESGLLGVSETSADMQELLKKEMEDVRTEEAVKLFCYSVKKWIGSYSAVLNGLDTLVFSGGIGENSAAIRSRICNGFDYLGIEIDNEENQKNATIISTKKSKVKIYVIPTDEEIIIANEVRKLYTNVQSNTQ